VREEGADLSTACQLRVNCGGKPGAVQSPESERAARIHGNSGTSQIGSPIPPESTSFDAAGEL
jgi:hypothetical protein